jgi:dihydrofolate reductase
MRKVIVYEWMSLDGVVQAPGAADEDRSGGFKHGGWHLRYFDQVSQEDALKNIAEAGAFLLGRRTYEIFASYRSNAPDEERVIADSLSTKPKYVASTTLTEPLECQNSKLLQGDIAKVLAALKREPGGDLHVLGSTELAQTLIEQGLVDEFRLMIDPLLRRRWRSQAAASRSQPGDHDGRDPGDLHPCRRRPASGGPVMSESSREAREEARRYVRRKRILYTILGIWIALSLMWFFIDLADDSSSWWFYWPMLGTGIGVAITGVVLLGIGGPLGAEWERREVDKYLRRRGNEP